MADQLGVCSETVRNWELGYREPTFGSVPRIIRFLGYNPLPAPKTLPGRLITYRRLNGLSRVALARRLGIDPPTLWRWESGRGRPGKDLRERIEAVLEELPKWVL